VVDSSSPCFSPEQGNFDCNFGKGHHLHRQLLGRGQHQVVDNKGKAVAIVFDWCLFN
jgi:hypothetical protein